RLAAAGRRRHSHRGSAGAALPDRQGPRRDERPARLDEPGDEAPHPDDGVLSGRAIAVAVRPTLLLWDIDGTLITSGGAGRKAIERAFGNRYGRADALAFDFSGMTDRAIVRGGLAQIGHECTDPEIDAALEEYVRVLHDEVA